MEIVKSPVLGYCYGVRKTLDKASECIETGKKKQIPSYSIGRLIHNPDVIRRYEELGLKVIGNPLGNQKGVALIRAHGIPDSLKEDFRKAGFRLIDSTCINIQESRDSMRKAFLEGRTCIVLGVEGHAETSSLLDTHTGDGKPISCCFISGPEDVDAAISRYSPDIPVCVVTQTTFPVNLYEEIVARLKGHFCDVVVANHPCLACTKRQDEVKKLCNSCDAVVVVGGRESENTRNLARIVFSCGICAYCVENSKDIDNSLATRISRHKRVGICAGTSTPVEVVDAVVAVLEKL